MQNAIIARSRPIVLSVVACLIAGAASGATDNVVRSSGAQFTLNDRPYVPVGYNSYRLTSVPDLERPLAYACNDPLDKMTAEQLLTHMSDLKAGGATVVRTWFFQSFLVGNRNSVNDPITESWYPFDRVLDAAAARGLKVIPVLVNDEKDCERPKAGNQEPAPERKRIDFYRSVTRSGDPVYAYDGHVTLRPERNYRWNFKDYAKHVAERYRSGYVGPSATEDGKRRYQTIAWWQLVNEASADTGPHDESSGSCPDQNAAAAELTYFTSDMVNVLRTADPDHLVNLGTIGNGQCGESTSRFDTINASGDICALHDYYADPRLTLPGDSFNGFSVRLAQCVGKPFFIGEAGIRADAKNKDAAAATVTQATLKERARYFDGKIARQVQEKGMDGYLIWQKISEASGSDATPGNPNSWGVGPGDPAEQITRSWSGRYGKVISDWEPDPVDVTPATSSPTTARGWTKAGTSLLLTPTAEQQNYTRFGSLMLTNYTANETTEVYLDRSAQGAGLDGAVVDAVPAGAVLTYRIHRPATASGATVTPFVQIGSTRHAGTARNMVAGWNVVMLRVPGTYTGQAAGLARVGLTVAFSGGQRYCESHEYDSYNCRYHCSSYGYATSGNQLYLDTVSFSEPALLEFTSGSYSVREGQTVALTMNRSRSSNGSVAVTCVKEPAATNGAQSSDFQATSETVVWADGDYLPKFCSLTAHADSQNEGDEYVTVRLTSPTVGALAGPPTAVRIENVASSEPPPPPEDPSDPYCYKFYRDCYIQSAPHDFGPIANEVGETISVPDPDVQPAAITEALRKAIDSVAIDPDAGSDSINRASAYQCYEP